MSYAGQDLFCASLSLLSRAHDPSSRGECGMWRYGATVNGGRSHMTSAKIWDIWTPSPCHFPTHATHQYYPLLLSPPPSSFTANVICGWSLIHDHALLQVRDGDPDREVSGRPVRAAPLPAVRPLLRPTLVQAMPLRAIHQGQKGKGGFH